MASSCRSLATVVPPINSITMSTSFARTTSKASEITCAFLPTFLRANATALSATLVIWMARPARRWISSALRLSTSHVPPPTVPMPSSPTRIGRITLPFRTSRGGAQPAVLAEHVADAARRLAQAVLVLDQRDPHMVVAVVAEADARRHRDLGVLEQAFGELDRAELAVGLRDLRPHVHRSLRLLDHPADVVQRLHHHVAPLLVGAAHFLDAFLRPFERDDGGDLHRREAAVVVVALDARERMHQVLVADHEADAPARHVVALRHGEELDRDVARAGHLHDRGRLVAVERDVGVGKVVNDQDVMLFCQ